MRKITIIGAGSTEFTMGLIADLVVEGSEWEVRMVDISQENLDVACNLAKRMAESTNSPITVKPYLDRADAIPGSDAVVTTVAIGGRRAWENDVFISRKYGIYQPVGDTIESGGISRALRTIPVMVDIANDVLRLAPEAYFVNYANPMAMNCRAMRKVTKSNVIGLCHGVKEVVRFLADFLEISDERCKCLAVGINHLTWFLEFSVDGKDAWPWIREKYADMEKKGIPYGGTPNHPLSWELFHTFDAFPAVIDRHVAEFFPQFHRNGEHYGQTLGVDRFSFEETIERGDVMFQSMADQAAGRAPLPTDIFDRKVGEHEQLVEILNARDGQFEKEFSVIVPNEGQVTNIARDFAVECPALISERGVEPLHVGAVPTGVRATVEKALLTVELAVEAALERDRKKFVQALICDGCVKSVQDAHNLADELLAAQKEFLPGW
jgi:alpha-galactosidase